MDPMVALGIVQRDPSTVANSAETNNTDMHTAKGVQAFSALSVVLAMLVFAFLAELIAHAE